MRTKQYLKSDVGSCFSFTLKKQVLLDEKKFWVLIDEFSQQFMLSAESYSSYGFSKGQTIQCKLDRINCSGKLFFEPVHPKYEVRSINQFKVKKKIRFTNVFGKSETRYWLEDGVGFGGELLYANQKLNEGSVLSCKILMIKKGKLFLISSEEDKPMFEQNQYYTFKVLNTFNSEDFGKVYELSDEFGNRHFLPAENYEHYSIDVGALLDLRIVKLSSKGYFHLEPKHAFYKEQDQYKFSVIDCIRKGSEWTAFVEDVYSNVIKIKVPEKLLSGTSIMCKVEKLKKGKPLLEFVSVL